MRNVKLLIPAITLAAVSSLSLGAQQTGNPNSPGMPSPGTTQPGIPQQQPGMQTTPAQPETAAPAVPAPSTANAPEVTNSDMRPVSGELQSKLDTKNARNGDPVVLKTTEKATFADGVEIPKGSKIMGHVTDVQAHDKANPNSKIAIQFDQAELKGGQTMPIKSVLQSVSPAGVSDTTPGASPFGTGSASSAPAMSPGAGASSASAGTTAPGTSAPMQGSAAAANPGGDAPNPSGAPAAGTVVAHQGNIDIKTTAIPGVLIAANSNGQPFSNASGALLGAKQNVHLDGGTKVMLAVAGTNSKVTNR